MNTHLFRTLRPPSRLIFSGSVPIPIFTPHSYNPISSSEYATTVAYSPDELGRKLELTPIILTQSADYSDAFPVPVWSLWETNRIASDQCAIDRNMHKHT